MLANKKVTFLPQMPFVTSRCAIVSRCAVALNMVRRVLKKRVVLCDERLGSNVYEKLLCVRAKCTCFLNLIRRVVSPWMVRWEYRVGVKGKKPVKLHLGCGEQCLKDHVNVDFRKTRATDLVCDVKKLPYPDNSVESITAYHVIEHLGRHHLPEALKEWHRVLVIGGKLIIECPDFDEAVKEYIQGNEKRIDNIFGLQRFPGDTHQFGYNFKRLKEVLEETGFTDIEEKEPQDYHSKDEPCLRVECVKADNS